ncbi:FHA domain-containing protein [Xanthomonas maliensis]|uniref:FHA domain-containing protein n=1 Tax=Xanthomonas maliensis TaxID=1321368 RepID=UPI0003AB357B|nr:FHA domain-containing protein [Xanthomonas maliensis]KAB7769308.1 FHA domain-containing protein [Xanthomonas maliensis]
MRDLQVHFSNRQQPDHPLKPGVHRIVRHASGSVRVVDDAQGALLLAQFCLDQRGLWLQVANGIRGIHVNGRPVRRMALLRAGDAVYADGVEMLLRSAPSSAPSDDGQEQARGLGEVCLVLRGLGGRHHGRSVTLDRPRLVGNDPAADIVIDDPIFAAQHARLERHGERVLLRDLGSEDGSWINGVPVRDGWLQAGDQLVFDTRHRFVVEVPRAQQDTRWDIPDLDPPAPPQPTAAVERAPVKVARWPWLLLSAVLLAAALSALLWFGAR